MNTKTVNISKFLSLILRHKPETIGLRLDANGWADVDELLQRSAAYGKPFTKSLLEEVVATNDKKRFVLSDDKTRIRASQGHSVAVDLELVPTEPPPVLFHGTATRFLDSIQAQGLVKGTRQHVHLSPDEPTAVRVGQRHGKPVVLKLDTAKMRAAGHVFYCSANGVWLTDHVPAEFLEVVASI